MKKLYFYVTLLLLFALLSNCTDIIEEQRASARGGVEIDTTSMVIKYPPGMSENDKAIFRKENKFKTADTDIERCPCGDTDIELLQWDFNEYTSGEIQTAKNNLKGGRSGAQGDEPFNMYIYPLASNSDPYELFPISQLKVPQLKIMTDHLKYFLPPEVMDNSDSKAGDGSINIAVIDTGLDLKKFSFNQPYLYPTINLVDGCPEQTSGWDFVNDDDNIWDDHGHGTYVTRIISEELQAEDIPFRILPIKAFSEDGKAHYWDMVCAMNYVKKINLDPANNNKIHFINASFGYGFHNANLSPEEMSLYKERSIFRSLIEELNETALVFGSAGNVSQDIDILKSSNFPASFPSDNLIGVGGYIDGDNSQESGGNFGKINLDLAAPYKFKVGDLIKISLTGSSFSTAKTSALGAKIKYGLQNNAQNSSPLDIRAELLKLTNNPWVKYDPNLTAKIDQGRYSPK